MSREWTVRAQLTISQPTGDQPNNSPATNGSRNGDAIAGDPQQSDKPITIIYEWTTAAEGDPNTAGARPGGVARGDRGDVILETVRSKLKSKRFFDKL